MLTLSMIVKNEEKYLRECLESVKGIADEIVLVDTGSTDATLNIAKEFNCKIYEFQWVNDFSAARNFALSKSTGEWILYLDADERLIPASKDELNKLVSGNKKAGIQCIVNSIDEAKEQPQIMKYIRLFRRTEGIGFEGKVHEQIEASLRLNNYEILDSGIEIIHVGYNVPKAELEAKALRNLELLKAEYEKEKSSYYAYQLANTYSIIKNREEARRYYKIALEDNKLPKEYRVYSLMYLADSLLEEGRTEEAERYIQLGLNENKNDTLLNLVASQVYLRKNNITEAIECSIRAYEQNEKLIKNKTYSKILNVAVRPEKIIFHTLYLSLLCNDGKTFNRFFTELKTLAKRDKGQILSRQAELIELLINNKPLNEVNLKKYSDTVNSDNLLLILVLIKAYKNKNTADNLLNSMSQRFGENPKFLSTYGLVLLDKGKLAEAAVVFRKGINLKEKDPAVFFYLISLYVQLQKFDEIGEIIEMAEKEFKDIPELSLKMNELKSKLSTLI